MLSFIGLIGDVHAEADLLKHALKFLRDRQVQKTLCVGDIVDGFGNVDRCCELLEQYEVETVRGNHDRWFLRNEMRNLPEASRMENLNRNSRSFLEALPVTRDFETVSGPLLLCHGLGENDMARLTQDDFGYALECKTELQELIGSRYRFVVGGHTHRRMTRHFRQLTIVNPGTLYRRHEPCLALIDLTQNIVTFHELTAHGVASLGLSVKLSEN